MYIGTAIMALALVLVFKNLAFNITCERSLLFRRMSVIIYMIHIWIFTIADIAFRYIHVSNVIAALLKLICIVGVSFIVCSLMRIPKLKILQKLC